MAIRYYLSPMVGDGTEDSPYRPKASLYSDRWTASVASDPITGMPAQTLVVVEVDAADHSALLADTDLTDITVA